MAANVSKNLGLEVEVIDKDDELWQKIWEYYIRAEVQMNFPATVPGTIKTKLFESATGSLINQDVP